MALVRGLSHLDASLCEPEAGGGGVWGLERGNGGGGKFARFWDPLNPKP